MPSNNKAEHLAYEVLRLSRDTLLIHFRFLDAALGQFTYVPISTSTMMTDGMHLYFNAVHVLESYVLAPELPTRDFLHIVLHCIFRHMYIGTSVNRALWDLACDIVVENMITELDAKSTDAPRSKQQEPYIAHLKSSVKHMTAEMIYAHLREKTPDAATLKKLQRTFCADDHAVWYTKEAEKEKIRKKLRDYDSQAKQTSETHDNQNKIQNDSSRYPVSVPVSVPASVPSPDTHPGNDGRGESSDQEISNAAMEAVWKRISERMQVELETFDKRQGFGSASLTQNLETVNREKYDYTAFLKKFAVMGEAMQINDDEFDYIFYTLGLRQYGNMPLIEPLEYKDVKRIREFVIAIDTSGSVQGSLVQGFIQKTYNILKSTESFFTKINLHIIQCDAEIQEDVKITSQTEFDTYLKTMKLKGFGGTDFRPVFRYVDELRKNKEFINLKGLIYFTDGEGTFPENKPDYETAFIFIEGNLQQPKVPSWAIKLILQEDDIS